jgi:hypothetical protein
MKYVLINYNFDPSWVKEYTDDYLIYDRSDDGNDWCKNVDKDKVIYTKNVGNVDYDRLGYIVSNYDTLPDVFVLAKSNLLTKFISPEEFEKVKNNTTFTPLLTQYHPTYSDGEGVVCYYENGMYHERNNSWYLRQDNTRHFKSFGEYARFFGIENPLYIPFAPGGNYILTRDTVYQYPKEFYEELRDILPYTELPGEAHLVERSYYLLWK